MITQTITSCLWFDNQAEEAAKFYTSVFKNSTIGFTSRYGKEGFEFHKMPAGTVMTISFELNGQPFTALNGGPLFKFNESISFQIGCETQKEIDYYWDKLTADGGQESACGWLKDKFGVSWQVTGTGTMMAKIMSDPEKSPRAMNALLKMKKLDLATLENA